MPNLLDDDLRSADALARGGAFWAPQELVVTASGTDAVPWLQGQLTQDVADIPDGTSRYALIVTVKGKILTELLVARTGETLSLLISERGAAAAVEQLGRHLVMEDVELTVQESFGVLSIPGRSRGAAEPYLSGGLGSGTLTGLTVLESERLGGHSVDLVGPRKALDAARAALTEQGFIAATDGAVTLVRMRHGEPAFGHDFGAHYPQEAGRVRGVSFSKGCYVGQEVVCRLSFRGRVQKRLALLAATPVIGPVPAGAALTHEGEPAGEVTSSVQDRDRTWLFGFVKSPWARRGQTLQLNGVAVTVEAVPGDPEEKAALP